MAWMSQTTAEHVLAVSEAAAAYPLGAELAEVAAFVDITTAHAQAALELAVELKLIRFENATGRYFNDHPLCRFLCNREQAVKATVLRVALESYPPFVTFRERFLSTADLTRAASQTNLKHGLTLHREASKETLISLGTYAAILVARGSGNYELAATTAVNPLAALAGACDTAASAEQRVRTQLGPAAAQAVSQADVIDVLAGALMRCPDPASAVHAVVAAGNAVESFLFHEAVARGVNLVGAHGVNAKLQRFKTGNLLPEKIIRIGNYIGQVRNAADHGVDPDIGMPWTIQPQTATEVTFVSCSFISDAHAHLTGSIGSL